MPMLVLADKDIEIDQEVKVECNLFVVECCVHVRHDMLVVSSLR